MHGMVICPVRGRCPGGGKMSYPTVEAARQVPVCSSSYLSVARRSAASTTPWSLSARSLTVLLLLFFTPQVVKIPGLLLLLSRDVIIIIRYY